MNQQDETDFSGLLLHPNCRLIWSHRQRSRHSWPTGRASNPVCCPVQVCQYDQRRRRLEVTYADIVKVNINKTFRGSYQVVLKCRTLVVQTSVGTEALDPATFLIWTSNADDFRASNDLVEVSLALHRSIVSHISRNLYHHIAYRACSARNDDFLSGFRSTNHH